MFGSGGPPSITIILTNTDFEASPSATVEAKDIRAWLSDNETLTFASKSPERKSDVKTTSDDEPNGDSSKGSSKTTTSPVSTTTEAALKPATDALQTPPTPTNITSMLSSSQTSPAPTPITPASGPDGLVPGPTAGLAVGCVLAGVILAIAAACVMARKRRRRVQGPPARFRVRSLDSDKQSSSTILRSIEKPRSSKGFDQLLTPPIPDRELLAMFNRLKRLLTNHAEKFLATGTLAATPKPDPSSNQRLTDLMGPECLVGPHSLSAMLVGRQTKISGAKHLLAKSILGNIESSGLPETTILPPELSECMASMAGMKNEAQGKIALSIQPQPDVSADSMPLARSTLLGKWRQITRVLMEPTYGNSADISPTDPRQINIRELADTINQILQPFVKESELDHMQSLTAVICEGAKFGYTVFTQPSEWRFEWTSTRPPGHSHAPEFVVFPAFCCKVADDNGHFLPVPEVRDSAVVSRGI
ncbi:hypothetical protein Q7P37_003400 [Cladosporium fusiforme]